jgi:hypothetical protein
MASAKRKGKTEIGGQADFGLRSGQFAQRQARLSEIRQPSPTALGLQ